VRSRLVAACHRAKDWVSRSPARVLRRGWPGWVIVSVGPTDIPPGAGLHVALVRTPHPSRLTPATNRAGRVEFVGGKLARFLNRPSGRLPNCGRIWTSGVSRRTTVLELRCTTRVWGRRRRISRHFCSPRPASRMPRCTICDVSAGGKLARFEVAQRRVSPAEHGPRRNLCLFEEFCVYPPNPAGTNGQNHARAVAGGIGPPALRHAWARDRPASSARR